MNYINHIEGKEFRVEIPRSNLTLKTYKEATEVAEILFGLGIKDVNIVAFRPQEYSE